MANTVRHTGDPSREDNIGAREAKALRWSCKFGYYLEQNVLELRERTEDTAAEVCINRNPREHFISKTQGSLK